MDDITIGVTEFVNNISVSAQPNDQIIDITVTETVETVLLDVSTTVEEVTVTATQNVIVENITVDYVNNENNIDINVTDATQDVTLNVTPTLVEINILRSGGEVNILQFNTRADFPTTGSIDYFYLAKDTNKLYRWTGSAYAEIAATANAVWGQIIGTLSEQTDLQNALNLKAPINSPTFTGTVSGITKGMVGLGAVDNTSDLDKPISTATQTALNNKQPLDGDLTSIAALSGTFGLLKKTANNSYTIDTNTYLTEITSSDVTDALGYTPENVANKGVNNGYASLDGGGKVPSSQLPSYVDDVIEVSSFGTLPTTGETGKIYITLDTNKIYRWTGSVYVEVSSSAAVWGGITGTLSNQTDLQTALDAKQDDLNGTGFVKASGTTISYDNTTYYPASNPNGYTTNVGTVTSVALSVPSAFSVSGSPITSSGTLAITGAGTTAQYVRGDGTLASMPDISGFVPYTGATGNVDLGTHTIIAAKGTFSSSGSGDTVSITHSSGSGIALNISKAGNGEGIYVNKTSGSGNAVTIIGTLNATTLVKSGGTSTQFLKADGSVDSSTYLTSASLSGYVDTTGDQSIAGQKTFTGDIINDGDLYIKQDASYAPKTGYVNLFAGAGNVLSYNFGNSDVNQSLSFPSTGRVYSFPDATGTIALTSDLHNAVTIGTANGLSLSTQVLSLGLASTTSTGALSSTDWNTFNNKASSASLANYLPLSGGTLTGALSGTSATFSGDISTVKSGNALLKIHANTTSSPIADIELMRGTNTTWGADGYGDYRLRNSGGDFTIQYGDTGVTSTRFTIASTGAATFSSSVQATSIGVNTAPSYPLHILRATGSDYIAKFEHTSASVVTQGVLINTPNDTSDTSFLLNVQSASTSRFVVKGNGNVGIGTTAPMTFGGFTNLTIASSTTSNQAALFLVNSNTSIRGSFYTNGSSNVRIGTATSHDFLFDTADTERMRITSGGNVFVGSTTLPGAGNAATGASLGSSGFITAQRAAATTGFFGRSTNNGELIAFFRDTTQVGNISVTTSLTSYNVTSDYRLKQDFKSVDGLDLVNKINVYNYEWKSDNTRMDGVLAHELAEILPYAVTGVKDGEQMQAVDYSKIVPVMVQAIKELKAELDTLKNK